MGVLVMFTVLMGIFIVSYLMTAIVVIALTHLRTLIVAAMFLPTTFYCYARDRFAGFFATGSGLV